jgi:hypothetical protein
MKMLQAVINRSFSMSFLMVKTLRMMTSGCKMVLQHTKPSLPLNSRDKDEEEPWLWDFWMAFFLSGHCAAQILIHVISGSGEQSTINSIGWPKSDQTMKLAIKEIVDSMKITEVNAAILNIYKRMIACIHRKGDIFEHTF